MRRSSDPSIVIDASVSLKWALPDEEHEIEASALRDLVVARGGDVFAASLWLYEVTSGLVVAVRRQRLPDVVGRQALADILDTDVQFVDPDVLEVFDDARQLGIGAHDAAHVTLARVLGLPLWTGDRRLHQTAHHSSEFIHWIGNFSL